MGSISGLAPSTSGPDQGSDPRSVPWGRRHRRSALPRVLMALAFAHVPFWTSTSSSANGRFPMVNQAVVSPKDPSHLVLRTTFGFLVSKNRGEAWDWICEPAVERDGLYDPPLGLLPSGRMVGGTLQGVFVSSEDGCSFRKPPLPSPTETIVDVTVAHDRAGVALALGATQTDYRDGGALFRNQVYRSEDDGSTWVPSGLPLAESLYLSTIDIAPSDGNYVYIAGTRGQSFATLQGVFLVSRDGGRSFVEREFPLERSFEYWPLIAAVDPEAPQRVYVRTVGVSKGRVLVTEDGGESFREIHSGGLLSGFALSKDGSRIFLGGPDDGIFRALRSDYRFERRSSQKVECLAFAENTLYACAKESQGFVMGASTDDGASFRPLLHLEAVRGPLSCPAESSVGTCRDLWPSQRNALGIQEDASSPADATTKTPVATTDAGLGIPPSGVASKESTDGGCATPPNPRPWGPTLFALVGLGGILALKGKPKGAEKPPRSSTGPPKGEG